MADELVMMPGRNGGSLRVGGPGRPKSQASIAIREARYQLKASLDALVAIRDAGKCEHCGRGASSADEITRAALGIMKLSGIEKEKPRPRKAAHFGVVRAGPDELARAVEAAAPDRTPAVPEKSGHRGPLSEKGEEVRG